jgi:hypothetical protein
MQCTPPTTVINRCPVAFTCKRAIAQKLMNTVPSGPSCRKPALLLFAAICYYLLIGSHLLLFASVCYYLLLDLFFDSTLLSMFELKLFDSDRDLLCLIFYNDFKSPKKVIPGKIDECPAQEAKTSRVYKILQ